MMASATDIPFTLIGGAQPLLSVPAFVNGRGPYAFIVDTGAGPTILAPHLAQELGVIATGSKEASGLGQRATAQLATIDSIRVGDELRESMEVAITPEVDRIAATVRARIDGVVGYSFLRHYAVTVDYPRNVLRLESESPRDSDVVIPFELAAPAKPLVVIPAMINGEGPFRLAVDTGASATLIDTALAQRLGMELAPGDAITGMGGPLSMSIGRLRTLAIGRAEARDLPVVVGSLETLSGAVGVTLEGIVGYDFMRRFRVTIDYKSSRLHFK